MVGMNLMILPLLPWFCVLIATFYFIILKPISLKNFQGSVSFRLLRLSESDYGQALQDKRACRVRRAAPAQTTPVEKGVLIS